MGDAIFDEILRRCLLDPYEYYAQPHSEKLYLALRSIFVNSKGASTQYISEHIRAIRPILDLDINNNSYMFDYGMISRISEQLENTSGYATIPTVGFDESILQLRQALSLTINSNQSSARHLILDWEILKRFDLVHKLCSDKSIKRIVDSYIGCNTILNSIVAWRTTYVPSEIHNESSDALKFHFDCDHNRFMKVFMYLDSVDFRSGPHVYAPKTSAICRPSLNSILHRDGRISNIDIINSGLSPTPLFGKAGTLIFADTHNLHRGTKVREGKCRYILSLQFVDSVFGAPPIHTATQIQEMNNLYR